MDKCDNPLDWKKVFKQILNGQGHSAENKEACLRESVECLNSNAVHRQNEKNLQESVSSSSFLHKTSSSGDNISKKKSSFQDRSVRNISVSELSINRVEDTISITKQQINFSKSDENIQVPEWNKVFRSILDKKSSLSAKENPNFSVDVVKKQENLQKPITSVNTRYTSRKKSYKEPKTQKDPEEENLIELFARSQMFKLEYHNYNEFEGAGVDIFNCKKKPVPKSFVKSASILKFTDEAHEYNFESYVPLKGFVANIKPYTTADLIAAPSVPFIEEPWDDDLLI